MLYKVIAAVGVIIVVLYSVFCVINYKNKKQREAIINVLELDKSASKEVKSVVDIVNHQSKISLVGCPGDFAKAYRNHQNAWRDMVLVEQEGAQWKQNYDSTEAFFRGLAFDFNMIGESQTAALKVQEHYHEALKNIETTRRIVLNIADDYGVDTSTYR